MINSKRAIGGAGIALSLLLSPAAFALPASAATGAPSISGTVTLADGSPAVGTGVVAFAESESGTRDYVADTTTDADGHYQLADLPEADVAVFFQGGETYAPEFYSDKAALDDADLVELFAGDNKTVDAVLEAGGRLTYRLPAGADYSVASAELFVRTAAGSYVDGYYTTFTQAGDGFVFEQLPPGRYGVVVTFGSDDDVAPAQARRSNIEVGHGSDIVTTFEPGEDLVDPEPSTPVATATSVAVTRASQRVGARGVTTAHVAVVAGAGPGVGSVTVLAAGTPVGSARLDAAGHAALTLPGSLPVGRRPISAIFAPADSAAQSGSTSAAVPFTVSKGAARITIALRPKRVAPGRRSRAVVTVAGQAAGSPAATGRIKASIHGRSLTAKLVRGTAVLRLPRLAPGAHRLRIRFAGDRSYTRARVTERVRTQRS